jgi:hypothetical protein
VRARWRAQDRPVKIVVITAAAVVGLFFIVKVLPYLLGVLGFGVLVAILFIPYWIPTIVAAARKHPSTGAILTLNLSLGWTFVGWVAALVWAVANTSRQPVYVHNTVVAGGAPVVPQPRPQYRAGDVVNGYRFTGASWVPVEEAPAPLPPPEPSEG